MAPNPTRAGPLRTAGLVCLLGAAFYSFPMILHFTSKAPIIDSNQPLKPEAVRRGAFNNSGSRDIGPDPDWVNGVRIPQKERQLRTKQREEE